MKDPSSFEDLPMHPDPDSPEARILVAATDEFASKGFYGARMQSIADAANINKAMLHYYFRTKENLYGRVIKSVIKGLMLRVYRSWRDESPIAEKVDKIIDLYMDAYTRNPGFLKIVLREAVDGGVLLRKFLGEIKSEIPFGEDSPIVELAALAGSELDIEPIEIVHMIVNLIGMCVISFISPPFLEVMVDIDLTDFDAFIEKRREMAKVMAKAYVDARLTGHIAEGGK